LILIASPVEAQLNYTTINGTVTITGYTGTGIEVIIPDTIACLPVTRIGDRAFQYTALKSIAISDSVRTIGDNAFYVSQLTNVIVGNGVTTIGTNAFAHSYWLVSVSLGSGVASIGNTAFVGCFNLATINFPDSLTNIGVDAFYNCAMTGVRIPRGVTAMDSAFRYCFCLTNLTIAEGVNNIGDSSFYECRNLASITIPDSLTYIGAESFFLCTNLTTVTIPNGVTTIGQNAFGLSGLVSASIGRSVSSIGPGALGACPNLIAINVDPLNSVYSSVGGALFDKAQTTLFELPEGLSGTYTMPGPLTSIVDWACENCTHLTGIYFRGNAPVLAGPNVFAWDNNLTIYYLPGTTGWGSPFGSLPAVLWNPLPQSIGGRFGVGSNGFGFNITGTPYIPIVVEASTSVTGPVWVPQLSCTLTNGSVYFADPQWSNYPARFYRIRSP
jgi:hypothetical protein